MRYSASKIIVTAVFFFWLFASLYSCASDPRAEEALEKLIKSYTSLKSFRQEVHVTTVKRGKEDKLESTLIFLRPNKVSLNAKGVDAGRKINFIICYDGKSFIRYNGLIKKYTRITIPMSLSKIRMEAMGRDFMILSLLNGEKVAIVGAGSRLRYGKNRDNLLVLSAAQRRGRNKIVISYFIDPGTFLLRRIQMDVEKNGEKITSNVDLRYTEVGVPFDESLFRFTPPAGAKEEE